MKKGVKIGIAIVTLFITVVAIILAVGTRINQSSKKAEDLELMVEKTYHQLVATDYQTESDYVQFAAFFVRDLDGDGYVERLDGTCKDLDEKDNLYIELNVLTQGYLENGLITINTDNNFLWNTTMIADSMIANNYVGNTNVIELKEKIQNGNQKLMWGKISPRLDDNINNYSKANSITLTGTHVIENIDGSETRTEINITKNVTVDWYGQTITELSAPSETRYFSELLKNNQTVVEFSVQASETDADLLLNKQVVEFEIPEFMEFEATNAYCSDSGVQSEYNPETKILTVTRTSEVDENGNVTKVLSRTNRYSIKVVYPKDAYNMIDQDTDTINLSIPTVAYNYGYNNDSKIGEENIFDNPYISSKDKLKTVSYIKRVEQTTGYIWKVTTSIGDKKYNRLFNNTVKQISKMLPLELYNGNIVTEEDSYPVTWKVDIGTAEYIETLVLDEKSSLKPNGCDSFNSSIDMRDYTKIKSFTVRGAGSVLGPDGWIKVYDADIDDPEDGLLLSLNKNNWNMTYTLDAKTIRVETSNPVTNYVSLYFDLVKVIDDSALVADYTEDEFDTLSGVYTYLKGRITAPDGVVYDSGLTYSTQESRDFAYYQGGFSVVNFGISKNSISSQKTENVEFTIRTENPNDLEEAWKNGIFLIELPEQIVKAKINDVTTTNNNVTISDYYVYKEDGKYFIKVYTKNETEEVYTLKVDADLTANPLIATTTVNIKLYGYNEFCDNYYSEGADAYDVDEDGLNTDLVAVRGGSITIKNIGSSGLNTTEYITEYDDNPESVTVAPNIADIEKSTNARTAKININIMNNFDGTLSEIVILGRIPYENNKYVLNEENLGSGFSTQMTGPLVLPESLESYATVYYSTKGLATKDLSDQSNAWKTANQITDWSTVKSYLVDLGDYTLNQDTTETLNYTVEVPAGLGYNSVSFSHHAVYYCLDTETGKLATQTEPNKVGLQVVGKYSLEISKYLQGNSSVVVPGVSFNLSTLDVNGDPLVQIGKTDRDGKILFENLYVEREYTLKEQSVPNYYSLLDKEIKFKATVGNNGQVTLEMLQDTETNFAETPNIVLGDDGYYVVKAKIENEPKYNIQLRKAKKNVDSISVPNAIYKIETQDHNGNPITVTGRTNENGIADLNGLYINEPCTLTEVNSPNDYALSENEIKFTGTLDGQGNLVIDYENEAVDVNGSMLIDSDPTTHIQTAHINIAEEAKVKLKLNKINEDQEPIADVRFLLSSSKGGTAFITDQNGEAIVSGLYTDVEYTLQEREAEGYYLADDMKFTITRNQNGELVVNSTDPEFSNAIIVEKTDENQNFMEVTVENEKIPTYTLNLLKVEEDYDEEDINNLQPLDGARYKVISEDYGTEYSLLTGANGIAVLDGLEQFIEGKSASGKYTIKEVEAPSGYVINQEEITFYTKNNNGALEVIVENKDDSQTYKAAVVDGTTVTIVVQDKAFFKLKKVDSETGLPLANADFAIYSVDEDGIEIDFAKDADGNYIGTLNEYGYYIVTSDANGEITLPLQSGLYKAVEVTYPEGYLEEITEEFFKITDGKEEEEDEDIPEEPTYQILEISYIEDLVDFAQSVKDGNNYADYKVLLMNDLDFEAAESYRSGTVDTSLTEAGGGTGFIGIGNYTTSFAGIFDGQNHTISNLYINKTNPSGTYYYQNNTGLFEILKGTVKNLTVTGDVTSRKSENGYTGSSGGIAGRAENNAIIENCHNKVNVINEERYGNYSSGAGGIVGACSSITVKDCTNEGTIINSSNSEYSHAGGIIGNCSSNTVTVINCHNSGTVKCDDFITSNSILAQVGGIYSFGYGELINCSNTGEIMVTNATSSVYIGGLVGQGASTTENCYNTGNISITKSVSRNYNISVYAGGIIGSTSNYKVVDSYNAGNITFTASADNSYIDTATIGGILGTGGGVKRCYNTGNIRLDFSGVYTISTYTEEKLKIGGIMGVGTVDNCYNTGNIDINLNATINSSNPAYFYAGGIAGYNSKARNCYNTGNVKIIESAPSITSYSGDTVGSGTVSGICAFINTIQIAGSPVIKGTSVSDSTLKSLDFYNSLNSEGDWTYNENAYPTLSILRETEINPVTEVNYIEDLVDIRDAIYNGYKYNGATVKLKRTLDFNNDSSYRDPNDTSYGDINENGIIEPIKTELTTGKGFDPIGISDRVAFDGTFDGKDYEIQNLYINNNSDMYVGLFGYVKGVVKNLNVTGQVTVDPGTINGTLSTYAGGIVGYGALIENCNSNVNVKVLEGYNRAYIGGVAGFSSTINNCTNSGKVMSYVTYTYTGSGSSSYDACIGGVVGNATTITKCSNRASVTSVKGFTGGVVGQIYSSNGKILECYNTGDVSGYYNVGGILGRGASSGSSIVRNIYNTGNVSGERYVGGLIGYISGISSINNAYNTGSVNAEQYVGAISGYSGNSLSDVYYLDTTPVNGRYINEKGVALNDAQLKSEMYYDKLNEDEVWQMRQNAYPILIKSIPENLTESTEITIDNTLKKFVITTDVEHDIGGTISGDNEDPYETVIYKEDNTKEIVMQPDLGYGITKITINGKPFDFELENPDDSFIMPVGYFSEMTEDKHIVVTYKLLDQILTIKKTNTDNEPLKDAEFNISSQIIDNMVPNPGHYNVVRDTANNINVDNNLHANGEYYFVKNSNRYESNAVNDSIANSYIVIDLSEKTGYYCASFSIMVQNGKIIARLTEDDSVYSPDDTTGVIADYTSTSTSSMSGTSRTLYLECGKVYYLHFTHIKAKNSNSQARFDSVQINPVTFNEFWFEKQGDSYVSNNQGYDSTYAYSYIPIDLTPITGKVDLTVNAEISCESSDNGFAHVSSSPNQSYGSNTSGRLFYISGTQAAQDYTTQLEGGQMYYLNFGYYKNNNTSSGSDALKINSVTISIDNVTTNAYGQVNVALTPGTYVVTETKAPEGYTLNKTPQTVDIGAGLANEVSFTNIRQTGVTVHHYYKNGNGEYTTYKVADDEHYLGDIGSEYSTTPKNDLEGLSIEKDGTGNYVLPDNAVGTYTEEGVVVNYYYESAPIKLTINHYIAGTETKLAEEKIEITNSELNQLTDGYQIVANGSYDVSENTDYASIIDGSYNLSYITSSVKLDTDIEDVINYTEDATLDYYYTLKQYTITTEVQPHTENRTNPETGLKEDVQVDGGTIKLEDDSDEEIVSHGEDSINTIIVTPDDTHTVKTITLVSTDEEGNETTTIVYGDGEDSNSEITYTENQDGSITISNFEDVIENKKVIVEFSPIYGNLVIHYYYEGTGEEYGNTPVKVNLTTGGQAENVETTDLVGEPYYAGEAANIESYYERASISGDQIGNYINGTIDVYYYYKYAEYEYTIEHYYENLSGVYEIDNNNTVTDKAQYLSERALEESDKKIKTGYSYTTQSGAPLTISEDPTQNIIKLYYDLNEYSYTVKYLEKDNDNDDSNNTVLHEVKTVPDVLYGTEITSSTEVIDIDGYNYDSLKPTTLTVSENEVNNVITIYYTKKNTLEYTVHYKEQGTEETLSPDKSVGNQVFGSTAHETAIDIDGYDKVAPTEADIEITTGTNEHTFYYTKKNTLEYTVHYKEQGTEETLSPDKVVGNQVFGDTAHESAIDIDGYEKVAPTNADIEITTGTNEHTFYYTKQTNLSYKVKYLEKDDDNDDSNNTVLHEEKNVPNVVFGTVIASGNEVINIPGYNYDSSDKASLTVGTTIANNVITLYYTKGTFGYEVHYFYDGVEDSNEKETSAATYLDVITYQDVIDNFGDKVRDGYALSGYTPVNGNNELELIISENPANNVINIYYRSQYKIEAEVIEHEETTKDGTTTTVAGGTIYEATNTPYTIENVFKGDDSEKSIIIVPDNGYEIVSITVTDSTGTVNLDLDEVVSNNGTATLNKDNGYFTGVNSDKKVEVEFRKTTSVIVKYLSATEVDDNGEPLVLATEDTITGYESKEFTTGRKPVTYYQNSNKGVTDENDIAIDSYDRVSLNTSGNAEGTMYADTLTIIYWYERIPAGIVVRHIEITEADKKAGLDMESGVELDSELLQGFVSLEETTHRNTYEKYIPTDGPVSNDEDLIIVSKDENSKTAIYKAVVDGEVIGLEFTEYDPTDYVVEVRYYYIKQYTISTEVKPHDENGQSVDGGTISGQDDDIYEIVNRMGENGQEIVITPEPGYRVKTITVNDNEIDITPFDEDENHVLKIPEGYFDNIDEDIVVVVELERVPAKVITKFVDIDTGEEITEEDIQEGFVFDPYETERKDVDTYVPAGDEPDNKDGTMTEQDTTVIYYYKKQFKITTDVIEHDEVKYILIELPKDGKQDIEIIKVKGGSITGEDELPYEIVPRGDSSKKAIVLKPDEHYKITSVTVNGEEVQIVNENGYTLAQFDDVQSDLHIEVKYERIPATLTVKYVDEETGEEIADPESQPGNSDSPYKTEPKDIDGYRKVRVEGNESGRLEDGENTVIYYYKKLEDLTIIEKGAGLIEDATNNVKNTIYNARTGDNMFQAVMGFAISVIGIFGIEKSKRNTVKSSGRKKMSDKFKPF